MDHSEIRRRANEALGAQYCLAGLPPEQAFANKWLLDSNNYQPDEVKSHLRGVADIAARAQTYAVTTEMTELVGQAAENLMFQWQEGDTVPEVLLPYDLPAKYGFVLFAHHLSVTGDYDAEQVMPTLGYLWADIEQLQSDHGVEFPVERVGRFMGGAYADYRGGVALVPISSPDRWASLGMGFSARRSAISRRADPAEVAAYVAGAPHVVSHDWIQWSYGTPWRLDPNAPLGVYYEPDRVRGPVDEATGKLSRLCNPITAIDRALIWSLFRLVEQRVPVVQRRRPDRAALRRALRKLPDLMTKNLDDGQVRIVMLRREAGAPASPRASGADDEATVEWTHRWQVEPHWAPRRVATRDEHGKIVGNVHGEYGIDWTYRRVWIERYEKGPTDKPLVLKDAVGVLKR